MSVARWHLDFETRCALDIKAVGAYRYSEHPTCELLCMTYGPNLSDLRLWIPGDLPPEDLFEHIRSGGIITAHNSFFEMCVFKNVCNARMGWPMPPISQFRCTAAKAASHALPRNLFDAGTELRVPVVKDKIGKKAMDALCKPRKPKAKENPNKLYWRSDAPLLKALYEYNMIDVASEIYVDEALPDLNPQEQSLWFLDQSMNFRGVNTDRVAMRRMAELVHEKDALLRAEFKELVIDGIFDDEEFFRFEFLKSQESTYKEAFARGGTKKYGRVKVKQFRLENTELKLFYKRILKSPEQTKLFLIWLARHGAILPDMKKETVGLCLTREDLSPVVRRAIKVRNMICKKSTAKLKKALLAVCDDGRLRDLLMYWGAKTGRWTGKLVQIHNLPKGNIKDTAEAIMYCLDHTLDEIEAKYKMSVMDVASSCLRGMLIASEDKLLFAADYSAIESRGVNWLADDVAGLETFAKGLSPYLVMASAIYGRECFKYVTKEGVGTNSDENEDGTKNLISKEYALGKQAELGCGYQMGALKFKVTCDGYKIDLAEVAGFEFCYKGTMLQDFKTKGKEKEMLRALIAELHAAMTSPENDPAWATKEEADERARAICRKHGYDPALLVAEHVVNVYRTTHKPIVDLWAAMNQAAILAVKTRQHCKCGKVSFRVDGRFLKMRLPSGRDLSYPYPEVRASVTSYGKLTEQLTFMGKDSTATNKGWHRLNTYGGKLTENAVQAVCRDLLAEAMIRLKIAGYDPLFTVHDELVCERNEGEGSVEEYIALMMARTKWAETFPVEIGKADAWIGKRYKK